MQAKESGMATKRHDIEHAWRDLRALVATVAAWLERVDPGTHRRIKGLRLVTAYSIHYILCWSS
jgi:hypothetical protein